MSAEPRAAAVLAIAERPAGPLDLSMYEVGENVAGEQVIWRRPGPADRDEPRVALHQRQVRFDPELWAAIVALVEAGEQR